jgi:hypothetical protein
MEKLIAYHGKQSIKDEILEQLDAHYVADEIIKGIYWENGKGCAVGCTIHSGIHSEYEPIFGIPTILAFLEDVIFEGLPNELAKEWPIKFMSAIQPGADLSKVWPKFAVFLLTDEKYGAIQYAINDDQKNAIKKVADLYSQNKEVFYREWRDAANAAASAANAASYAGAYFAARAANAAAYTAASAAARAASDTNAAAYTAAHATGYAAREKHRIAQAEKLLELLEEAI